MNKRLQIAIKVASRFIRLAAKAKNPAPDLNQQSLFDMGEAIEVDKTDHYNQVFGALMRALEPDFSHKINTAKAYTVLGLIHAFKFKKTGTNTFEYRPDFHQGSMFDEENTKPVISMDITITRSGKWDKLLEVHWDKKVYASNDKSLSHPIKHTSGILKGKKDLDLENSEHQVYIQNFLMDLLLNDKK
jgi:hypothetical protein